MNTPNHEQIKEAIMPYLWELNTKEVRQEIIKKLTPLFKENEVNLGCDIEDTTTDNEIYNHILSFAVTDETGTHRFEINTMINE